MKKTAFETEIPLHRGTVEGNWRWGSLLLGTPRNRWKKNLETEHHSILKSLWHSRT